MNSPRRPAQLEPSQVVARLSIGIERLYQGIRNVPLPEGVTPERLAVLRSVAANGPVSVTALAELHSVRPTTMSRMISGLDAEGWVRAQGNRVDRRGKLIELSVAGRRIHKKATDQLHAYVTAAIQDLACAGSDNVESLVGWLENIADSLAK